MKFLRNEDGVMLLESRDVIQEMKNVAPISTMFVVDIPNIKKSIKSKSKNFLKNSNLAVAPMAVGVGAGGVDSEGLIWNTFLHYIFPWMLDIAKVYCLVRIAQAFYEEKRGGKDSGTGWSALVTHGKWYLIFWLLPLGVELIDEIGHKMYSEISHQTLNSN